MNERDLYHLLQEIIGTNQYETKKVESLKTFDQISMFFFKENTY